MVSTRLILRHRRSTGCRRKGITLYEVVLALGIFAAAMVALGQSVSTGSRAAIESRLQTQAIMRCQSKLAELISGMEPMQAVSEASFVEGGKEWSWSLDVTDGPHPDLVLLEVTVHYHAGADVDYSIRRIVRDPELLLDSGTDSASDDQSSNDP